MEVWVGIEKIYGCSLCGATVKPVKTVICKEDSTTADLCQSCWDETRKFLKFTEGLYKGKIEVRDF